MVPPRGIEPRSSVLQTVAMTTSAKAAYKVGAQLSPETRWIVSNRQV